MKFSEPGPLHRTTRIALAVLLVLSHPLWAATIVVDETTCTLVDAITAANTDTAVGGCPAGSGADTIELISHVILTEVNNGTIGNATGLPVVTSEITLIGGNRTIRRIGENHFRIFRIDVFGNLQLYELTISGGVADLGAGLFNSGQLSMTDCTVSANDASQDEGTLSDGGGGILNGGTAVLDRVTISGNIAFSVGGGIYNGNQLTITNSTISDNFAWHAGGIFSAVGGVTITNTTVIGNESGLGGVGMQATNSIFAENIVNCEDIVFVDGGGNFADDSSCGAGLQPITPGIDIDITLADNGGPTLTHALLPDSVAIDAAGDCGLDTDQRGFPRDAGACDSGSVEFQGGGDVPASSTVGLLFLLGILAMVSWAILRPQRRTRHTT